MNYLIAAEPQYFSRYTPEEIAQIKRNSIGKIGIDCSGLVGWLCTGDKQYSTGHINNCTKYNTLQDGPTGSILYTSWGGRGRHIGLDIGNGYTLQAGWESTDANIRHGNAGKDITLRLTPENICGHYGVDLSDDATMSSGTTALGIAYTDVATAYVEMVDFVRSRS